jgi:hypothetical protein
MSEFQWHSLVRPHFNISIRPIRPIGWSWGKRRAPDSRNGKSLPASGDRRAAVLDGKKDRLASVTAENDAVDSTGERMRGLRAMSTIELNRLT